MKQTEIKPCAACGKGVMHAGAPQFYQVTVQHGLEQMLGGNATIAFHIGEPVVMFLCQDCGITEQSIAGLLETEERKR